MTCNNRKYSDDFCDRLLAATSQSDLLTFSVVSFCVDINISERTYYNYIAAHPEFRAAHEIALARIKNFWLKLGALNLENKEFSHWGLDKQLMRRFGENRIYLEELEKASSFTDKANIIVVACSSGQISIEQAQKLLDICERAAQLAEHDSVLDRIERIEEALMHNNNQKDE